MNNFKAFCAALLCTAILTGCGSDDTASSDIQSESEAAASGTTTAEILNTMPAVTTEPPLISVSVLPGSWQINVPPLLQEPELPAGCEITSLTCLLNYLGYPVDKVVMADTYLDYVLENGTDYTFFEKYIGDPHANGYGCYSPVIVKAAMDFLADQNSSLEAVNLSGSTMEEILLVIASGHPVVIWNTLDTSPVSESIVWTTPEGEDVYWCNLEHCMLLTGYDRTKDTVTVCDPMKGEVTYNLTQFFSVYDDMYQQAMTIY